MDPNRNAQLLQYSKCGTHLFEIFDSFPVSQIDGAWLTTHRLPYENMLMLNAHTPNKYLPKAKHLNILL